MTENKYPDVPVNGPFIALWGSCNPTTWRMLIAIPWLIMKGILFYNPQIESGWNKDIHPEQENYAKLIAFINFVVIDKGTRSLVSIIEAIEFLLTGRNTILVIQDVKDGEVIEGQVITGYELVLVNTARKRLRILAGLLGVPVYATVEEGLEAIPAFFGRTASRPVDLSKIDYRTEQFMNLGADPLMVNYLFDAVVASICMRDQLTVFVPETTHLEGQTTHGLEMVGRRLKDFLRLTDPYILDILKRQGVIVEMIYNKRKEVA